jgi:hypothetical protein
MPQLTKGTRWDPCARGPSSDRVVDAIAVATLRRRPHPVADEELARTTVASLYPAARGS